MWHFRLKCQRIIALVNISHKKLKIALALEVKKFGSFFLVLKLGKFSIFDNFFSDLANFWDLNNLSLFDFPDFLLK